MSFREFVILIAALMALNALAIDIMLPALQEIGSALGVQDENRRQVVLSAYLVGFGVGQLLIGTISDRFGRKAVLLWGLVVYVVAAALCSIAPSFEALLIGRVLQGLASAAPRVITISVVRDCYSGRRMASVMSLSMMVFMAVPVLAPSLGQLIILVAPWRGIFGFLTLYGLVMLLWVFLRMPETLSSAARRSVAPHEVLAAFGEVLTTRRTLGYALASGAMFGAMFGFLVSAQQVFTDIFGLGAYFPLAFAAVALTMSLSSFLNARLVDRLGMKMISHGAVAVFTLLSAIMALLARIGLLSFVPFMLLLAGIMFLVGMVFSNFNTLAMEPQGWHSFVPHRLYLYADGSSYRLYGRAGIRWYPRAALHGVLRSGARDDRDHRCDGEGQAPSRMSRARREARLWTDAAALDWLLSYPMGSSLLDGPYSSPGSPCLVTL
jgi:DHA1 family bicyclomycin/chloramphenicol resistance-like MFS transporter